MPSELEAEGHLQIGVHLKMGATQGSRQQLVPDQHDAIGR